jgi:hypothetical protein
VGFGGVDADSGILIAMGPVKETLKDMGWLVNCVIKDLCGEPGFVQK